MANRLVSVSLVGVVATGATIFACGGDDSAQTQNHIDAKVYMDAKVYLDAPGTGSGYMGIGQPCTPPSSGSGQGDCAAGYTCLNLQGASHPWCSKPCNTAADTCSMGYTGPGIAGCIESITFGSGMAAIDYCGVTCAGDGVNGCTTATCNGTCPGQMTCNGTLLNGSNQPVGSACQ